MGFFDRFAPENSTPSQSANPSTPTPAATAGGVMPQLIAARERLDAKDLPSAIAIYEELLRTAGDRADILVTLSGDLGSCGYVEQIVELVAPRYDAERHGPATGINLLQAYLATHNTGAAQHLLDILFSLSRPELEERLFGFSNVLAELIEAERRGQLPTPSAAGPDGDTKAEAKTIHLVSISRPIWSYGLEAVPNLLPPKEGRLRRVAFSQLALLDEPDWLQKTSKPEDELGRLCRGLPLWLAETLYFSQNYAPSAAIGFFGKDHYALFGSEWTTANIRQLVDTTKDGLDYVFTGALRHRAGDYELVLRLWEVKKFRERKTFTVRWTPATANAELTKLHEQLRMFMEWSAYPAGTGLTYAPPPNPFAWCDTLGSALSFFLTEKSLLPKEQLASPAETIARIGARAASSETASLAWLALRDRAPKLGVTEAIPPEAPLAETPVVEETRRALGL